MSFWCLFLLVVGLTRIRKFLTILIGFLLALLVVQRLGLL